MRRKCASFFVGMMVFVFGNVILYALGPIIYGGPFAFTIIFLGIAYAIMMVVSAILIYILSGPADDGGRR